MGPCVAVEGAITSAAFEAYLKNVVLAPSLRPGQVVGMDNLSSHKGSRVRRLIGEQGSASCITCLPTHRTSNLSSRPSPSSRPRCLALRRAGARTFEALVEAMGQALLDEITNRYASGFFRHCGYHASAQLL